MRPYFKTRQRFRKRCQNCTKWNPTRFSRYRPTWGYCPRYNGDVKWTHCCDDFSPKVIKLSDHS